MLRDCRHLVKNYQAVLEAEASEKTKQWGERIFEARSSVVPFVTLASDPQDHPHIYEACSVLIKRAERFSKTALGWALRVLSKQDKTQVASFVDEHMPYFSKERLNTAFKYFDKKARKASLEALKQSRRREDARTSSGHIVVRSLHPEALEG